MADSVKFGGGVTVSSADVLMPSEVAVMVEVPAAIPVANPVALMVAIAVLLLANARELPAMELPYWSLGVAVNCWVTPTCTDADCGLSVIEERAGDAVLVAAVGLPPQLADKSKRTIRAKDARDISFRFFFMIAKPSAPTLRKEQCNRRARFRIALRLKLRRTAESNLRLGIPSRETT